MTGGLLVWGGRDRIRHALHAEGSAGVVWEKKTIDVKEEMQGRSLSPLDVALSAGITSGLSQSSTPKDYALRDHL